MCLYLALTPRETTSLLRLVVPILTGSEILWSQPEVFHIILAF